MATGAAIGAVAIGAYSAWQGAQSADDAADAAADATRDASRRSTRAQMRMFEIARSDLAWARQMGANALNEGAPGVSQEMTDFSFGDAPTLGQFSHEGTDRGDFAYGEEETKPFKFEFDEDNEIYQWKKKETQRLVDQKMASMGNMGSTANLTRSNDALMGLMSNEVEEQYNRQWKTYTTNAMEYGNRFSRALTTRQMNTADDARKFSEAMNTFASNESSIMNQFNMENSRNVQEWNRLSSLNAIEREEYNNAVNVGLSGSGASAAAATTTGQGIANSHMQTGGQLAGIFGAQGQTNANLWGGLGQLGWQGLSLYGQMGGGQPTGNPGAGLNPRNRG